MAIAKLEQQEYLLERVNERLEQAYGYLDKAMEEGLWNDRQWNDLSIAKEAILEAVKWIDPAAR